MDCYSPANLMSKPESQCGVSTDAETKSIGLEFSLHWNAVLLSDTFRSESEDVAKYIPRFFSFFSTTYRVSLLNAF